MSLFFRISVLLLCAGIWIARAQHLSAEQYFVSNAAGGNILAVDTEARQHVSECAKPNTVLLCKDEQQHHLSLPLQTVQGASFVGDSLIDWRRASDNQMRLPAVHPQTWEIKSCERVRSWVKLIVVIERAGQRGVMSQTTLQPALSAALLYFPPRNGTWGAAEGIYHPEQGEIAWSFVRQGCLAARLHWFPDGSKEIVAYQQGARQTVYCVSAGESLDLISRRNNRLYFLHDAGAEWAQFSAWKCKTQHQDTVNPKERGEVIRVLFSPKGALFCLSTLWDKEQYTALPPPLPPF